jgi:hypothetical protein
MRFRISTIAPLVLFCGHAAISKAEPPAGISVEQAPDEPRAYWDQTLSAPRQALELSLATSLVAGLGQIPRGGKDRASETLDSGTSAALGVGYRASPSWAFELSTAYEFYDKGPTSGTATSADGAVARVSATYHFDSRTRTDPWLKAGAGYRWLQESDAMGTVHEFHGFDLTGLAAGLDLRVDPRIAFGPALGADLNLLLWDRSHATTDPHVSVFWYLGVQVRIDLSGRLLSARDLATAK